MKAEGPGGAGSRVRAGQAARREGALSLRSLLLVPVCAIGAFVLVVLLFDRPYEPPGGHGALDDLNSARALATLLAEEGSPLAADGRVDAYGVLERCGCGAEDIVRLCTSKRLGKGPTAEEVAARNYANFPWQRRKGAFDRAADPPVPILWEREPKVLRDGPTRVVAYSDTSAVCLHGADTTLDAYLRANPDQE